MTLELAAHFAQMARNNRWSNHRLYGVCAGLSDAALHGPRTCFFGSIHATLEHILLVDHAYLERLGIQGLGGEAGYGDLASLRVAQTASDRALTGFCDSLDGAALSRVVRFTNSEQVANADPAAAVLIHLFVHQIHHRGQVHGLLSDTDMAPPQLDEFFLSGDRPRREAELRELGLAE